MLDTPSVNVNNPGSVWHYRSGTISHVTTMRRRFSIPTLSEREARISILATVLFTYIGRHVVLTTMLTWRGWSEKPAWFWRPFTGGSLIVAAVAALFWPCLGGDGLYVAVFGVSFFAPTPPHLVDLGAPLVYATLCYIVWSLALLPHTLVRLGTLVYAHFVAQRNETRSTNA